MMINSYLGDPTGPETFGIFDSLCVANGKKKIKIQASQTIIQATKSNSAIINMVWGTRGPGTLWDIRFPLHFQRYTNKFNSPK